MPSCGGEVLRYQPGRVLANDNGTILLVKQDSVTGALLAQEARYSVTRGDWVPVDCDLKDHTRPTRSPEEWAYEMGWQVLEVR